MGPKNTGRRGEQFGCLLGFLQFTRENQEFKWRITRIYAPNDRLERGETWWRWVLEVYLLVLGYYVVTSYSRASIREQLL